MIALVSGCIIVINYGVIHSDFLFYLVKIQQTVNQTALKDPSYYVSEFKSIVGGGVEILESGGDFAFATAGGADDIGTSPASGKKMSEDLGIPLLCQIPIDPQICECGDLGVPITVAYPESPQSEAFRHAAQQLAGQVEELEQDELTIT